MEPAVRLDRARFARDWIDGVSAAAFLRRVNYRRRRIRDSRAAARYGVLLLDADPVAFTSGLVAALVEQVPVILGNPRWRRAEFEALGRQLCPGLVFGRAAVARRRRRPTDRLPAGAVLVPTGGSTAGLRFARHDRRTLSAHVAGFAATFGPEPVNSCCVLPLFHVSGLMQVMRSMLTGGRIAFPSFDDLLEGRFPRLPGGPACLSLVPTQLQRLSCRPPAVRALRGMRCIFVGGAPASPAELDAARRARLPVVPSYGMTETASMVCALPPGEFLAGGAGAGRPLDHAAVRIVDRRGRALPAGREGRIQVSATSLFLGFHGAAAPRRRSRYATGDAGYVDRAGVLHVTGRLDRIVVTRGEKVDPREVEGVLMDCGRLDAVLVTGWPHPEWGRQLVAFYRRGPRALDRSRWDREIRARLAHYKVPRIRVEVDNLPLDQRGKVDRVEAERLLARHLKACSTDAQV